jgi:hypothetical protein
MQKDECGKVAQRKPGALNYSPMEATQVHGGYIGPWKMVSSKKLVLLFKRVEWTLCGQKTFYP